MWPVTQPATRGLEQQRLGPSKPTPTWAKFGPNQRWSFISDRRRRAILGTTKPSRRSVPWNPSSLRFTPRPCLHPSEQRCARRSVEPGQRSGGAITWSLAGGRGWARRRQAIAWRPLAGIPSRSTLGWCRRAVELGAPFSVTNGVGSGER
jgi:hypothetical protein